MLRVVKKLDIHEILEALGNGKFQLLILMVAVSSVLEFSLFNFAYIYLGYIPDHWCHFVNGTDPSKEWREIDLDCKVRDVWVHLYRVTPQNNTTPLSASMVSLDEWYKLFTTPAVKDVAVTVNNTVEAEITLPKCANWEYDKNVLTSTVVTEWDLVCERKILAQSISSMFNIGAIIGALCSGPLADRFGRRTLMIAASSLHVITGIVAACAPSTVVYLVTRVCSGISTSCLFSLALVVVSENVIGKMRVFAVAMMVTLNELGVIVISAFAAAVRNASWRVLQACMLLPGLGLFALFFLSESPRWLLSKGKFEKARQSLANIAKMNNAETADGISEENLNDGLSNVAEPTLLSFFKTKVMRKVTFLLPFPCILANLISFDISFNLARTGHHIFLDSTVNGICMIAPNFFLPFVLNRIGRRWTMFALLAWGGTFMSISAMISENQTAIKALLYLAQVGYGSTTSTLFMYVPEVMPSRLRATGQGLCLTYSLIGQVIAAYAPLLTLYSRVLQAILYACATAAAAVLILLMPETKGKPIPETVEDVERLGGGEPTPPYEKVVNEKSSLCDVESKN